MKSPKMALLALLTATITLLTVGCSGPKNETSIPWSRPATWENQVPGMGSMGNTSGTR